MIAPGPCVKRNIEYMKPLFKLSNLFGIYQQPGVKPRFLKIYSLFLIALLILSTIITLPKRLWTCSTNGARKYLDITISLWRTAINILILFSLKDENILVTQFKDVLENVGNILTQFYDMNCAKRQRVFLMEMVCIITLLTGSLIGKVYANFKDPTITYSNVKIFSFFIECVEKYIVTITIMIFYNLVLSVKDKFNFINAKLAILNFKTDGDIARILQAFSKAHYLLCEAVEYINDNFGYMLFGLILMISLDLIMGVNVVITLILHGDAQQNVPTAFTLLPSISTSVLFLSFGIIMITSCEQTVRHAFHTTQICYNLSLQYSGSSQISGKFDFKEIRKSILLLAHQASQRKPNFTAADFFSINFYLLGAMLGTIVSYVIIFVQMK